MTVPNIAPSSISAWRPLSDHQTEPSIGTPRLLIFHTMVGYLKSTERYFKDVNGQGFSGTESTWGVGGPWDGADLDGVAWQWQGTRYQADAQFAGNAYANSIETSDGGTWKPRTPEWSDKQVKKLIQIGAWWCRNTGRDPVLARSWDGYGLGYHALFSQWNTAAHACPGTSRIAQLREVVIPGIAKALDTKPPVDPPGPAFPLSAGNAYGTTSFRSGAGLATWQRQMRNRGWTIGVDGQYGPQTKDVALAFQAEKHLVRDGLIGKATWDAAWRTKITN